MNTKTQPRNEWIVERAYRFVTSQGYGDETAKEFAQYAIEHCPEVQGFANLFDCFMAKQD